MACYSSTGVCVITMNKAALCIYHSGALEWRFKGQLLFTSTGVSPVSQKAMYMSPVGTLNLTPITPLIYKWLPVCMSVWCANGNPAWWQTSTCSFTHENKKKRSWSRLAALENLDYTRLFKISEYLNAGYTYMRQWSSAVFTISNTISAAKF